MSRLLLWAPFSVTLLFSSFVYVYSEVDAVVAVSLAVAMLVPGQLFDLITGQVRDARYDDYQALRYAPEYRLTSALMAVKLILLIVFMLYAIADAELGVAVAVLTGIYAGMSCGTIGMIVAHELMHKQSLLERGLAELLLLFMGYAHFLIYHVHGHHVWVGTPLDCTTARRGETVYAFVWRSAAGSYVRAWQIQLDQLRKRGRSFLSARNAMLRFHVEQIALLTLIGFVFGPAALVGFLVFAAVSIITVETINYTQHYGLLRARLADGRYEPVSKMHSWNFGSYFSNMYALNLGRHSDHHLQAAKGFQVLQHMDGEPTLPWGMFTMFCIALVPPLWFRIVDPRLDALGDDGAAAAAQVPAEGFGIAAATLAILLSVVVSTLFNVMLFFPLGLLVLAAIAAACVLRRRQLRLGQPQLSESRG